jgi:hypothetical protein
LLITPRYIPRGINYWRRISICSLYYLFPGTSGPNKAFVTRWGRDY